MADKVSNQGALDWFGKILNTILPGSPTSNVKKEKKETETSDKMWDAMMDAGKDPNPAAGQPTEGPPNPKIVK